MTGPVDRAAPPGPRRAIWGLVNDGYALVAKTANLSYDEAFELCRVPDIGDPSTHLDHGAAYLHSPKWGHVFARYFTNAERDSAGRASLVYDVVALSAEEFSRLRSDAFQALPPIPPDRRPERFGELPTPSPEPRTEGGEAARLTELLASEEPATLDTLLGALLAGDRVLCVAGGVSAETIECLTLLLPPPLRALVTFQSPTVDFPRHTPRLTVAERGHALLVEREWTSVLPRDAGHPRLVEARATAARLVALGRAGDRLPRAWTAGGGRDLQAAVARMLRMDLLHEGLRGGDLRRAVLVTARTEDAAEQRLHADTLFEHSGADRLADALADVVRGGQRDAWAAVRAVAASVAARRDERPEPFDQFFRAALERLRDVPRPTGDANARDVHVMLACAAAALGDLERFLDFADPSLPWDGAWRDGSARWVKGRSAVARLFDAVAARGATYADAIDGVHAVADAAATATPRARARAPALALALVRRTLRERATLEPPDRLGALVEGLMRIWRSDGGAPLPGVLPASRDDVEASARRFLGIGTGDGVSTPAAADARRVAAELSRAVAETADGSADPSADASGDAELLGWVVAGLERAHAGALGELTVRAAGAVLEEQRRLAPRTDMPAQVGRVLLHFAASDAAFVFRPAWLDVTRQVDDSSRRELLARALAWVARGYAAGRFTIGAFTDACAVAGGDGCAIDDATVELLVPHLAAASARGGAVELALLAATLAAVATPSAAERLTDALLGGADDGVADTVRMRRLALALREVEQVRDEERYDEARTRLRRVLARRGAVSPDAERALRLFLAVDDATVLGRMLGRLTSAGGRA